MSPPIAHCTESQCGQTIVQPCSYVDAGGRSCATSWCAVHAWTIGGEAYCRRHAGTKWALAAGEGPALAAPDIDNRAPALIYWVSGDLDAEMRALLSAVSSEADAVVVSGPITLQPAPSTQVWVRSWWLAGRAGTILTSMSLEVDEARSERVVVRVNHQELVTVTPPWIEQRLAGLSVDAEEDAARRRRFYRFIGDVIAAALGLEPSA
ncbi:MAG: hypothetical protein E6J14_08925 [Chloroflexi bacterium]|nr:MAG: hypothetical protein E6J14_08925 [Chloroflexota bacterium]